jgi:hypothetical protein
VGGGEGAREERPERMHPSKTLRPNRIIIEFIEKPGSGFFFDA